MKIKEKPKKENSERWLLTYSDLITLLMILFILLYAMSNVSEEKYQRLSESLSESLGGGNIPGASSGGIFPENGSNSPIDIGGNQSSNENEISEITSSPSASIAPEKEQGKAEIAKSLTTEKDMDDFNLYVEAILDDMNLGVSVNTLVEERGLTITFKNDVFFDSGQDALKKEMKEGLNKIALLINKVDNPIVIEGHTDNVPISSKHDFASNWQLSAARAANVAQYLVEQGKVDGGRISAIGYGEYRPVASNQTSEGRSKNRRVDIIILYHNDIG